MCGIGLVFHNKESSNGGMSTNMTPCHCDASCNNRNVVTQFEGQLLDQLRRRGPDVCQQVELPLVNELNDCPQVGLNVKVMSSVLNMRNDDMVPQPITDENFTLQWNGQVYPYNRNDSIQVHQEASIQPPLPHESDTKWLHEHIRKIVADHLSFPACIKPIPQDSTKRLAAIEKIAHQIRDFFENPRIKGPYAFCIVIPKLSGVVYGRDKAGRRSLVRVIGELESQNGHSNKLLLGISSTGFEFVPKKCIGRLLRIYTEDVSVEGVHYLHVNSNVLWPIGIIENSHIARWNHPFLREHPISMVYSLDQRHMRETHAEDFCLPQNHPIWTRVPVPSFSHHPQRDTPIHETLCFLHAMYDAVAERILTASLSECECGKHYVGLLFSGGIDSMLLAALIHWVVEIEYTSSESARFVVELLNVAFGESPESSPDRISARAGLKELTQAFPGREFRLFLIDASDPRHLERIQSEFPGDIHQRIRSLVLPSDTVMDLNIGTALWFASTGIGSIAISSHLKNLEKQRRLHRTATLELSTAKNAEISVQEGEDMFEILRNSLHSEFFDTSAAEKTKKLPISVFGNHPYNIPYKKYGFSKLVHYMKAAQRSGVCEVTFDKLKNYWIHSSTALEEGRDPLDVAAHISTKTLHRARARLLFSGLGADETLAGYRRHRTAFHSKYDADKSSSERLFRALDADCSRLWSRNLGRDDRCCSDKGKEMATPFLDEKVIDCIRHVYLSSDKSTGTLFDMLRPEGIGDKKIVRTAARMTGLTESTTLIKRAIQFGSRIADRRIKGSERMDNVDSCKG